MESEEYIKKYGTYLVIAFILLMVVFMAMGIYWVKNDNNSKAVEDSLKDQLFKDPIKSTSLSTAQNSSANQSQAAGQANQMAQSQASQTMQSQAVASSSAENSLENSSENESETVETKSDDNNEKFESANLKISFSHPKDVIVSESSNLLTLTKPGISWKIRFYDNRNKKELENWYRSHFDIKTDSDCSFVEPAVKIGSYTSKLVKNGTDSVDCDGAGNYAINTDKSKVVRVDLGKETAENANKILESFEFIE